MIIDAAGNEVLRVGRYYGSGRTNNEAEAFAMRDCMQCLSRLVTTRPELQFPARIWGDS